MSDNNLSCDNHRINNFAARHLSHFYSKEFIISGNFLFFFFDSALQIFLKTEKYCCKDFTIGKTEVHPYSPRLVDNGPKIMK